MYRSTYATLHKFNKHQVILKNTILPVFLTQIQRPGQASSWAQLVVPHDTQISQQEGSEPKTCGSHQHKASGLRLPLVVGLQLILPQNLALRPRTLPPSRTKGGPHLWLLKSLTSLTNSGYVRVGAREPHAQ